MRVEMNRTVCSCAVCQYNCRTIPGYLLPDDIERLMKAVGEENLYTFGAQYLSASPGAVVMRNGEILRIPTLVPNRQSDGTCHWFNRGLCAVHAVAPFGCAFFDCSMNMEEADRRSSAGLQILLYHWDEYKSLGTASHYVKLWMFLEKLGYCSVAPDILRKRRKENLDNKNVTQ